MRSPRSQHRGFTLIEILVVISIIVILAALTVPVFNVLTGSRSIDGATNTVSAMLARARGEALSRQQPVGLAVFTDVLRDRTALALVSAPLPWTNNTAYQRGDVISYVTAPTGLSRPIPATYYFICHTAHVSAAGDPNDGPPPFTGSSPVAGRWTLIASAGTGYNPDAPNLSASPPRRYGIPKYVSVIPESELMYLPPGVGAQVLNSARSTGSPAQLDRYLHAGVIFFDADGRLAVGKDWGVLYNEADSKSLSSTDLVSSRLGLLIQFDANPASSTDSNNLDPVPGSSSDRLRSGLGVLLFDRQAYLSQGFSLWDAQFDPTRTYTGSSPSEQTEESWLDANGTLLLLNRYNGTLLRTE
jgi:prepilin-type N-terminal cleavage/methylation domain-containing protein